MAFSLGHLSVCSLTWAFLSFNAGLGAAHLSSASNDPLWWNWIDNVDFYRPFSDDLNPHNNIRDLCI
jgi:hypothetical protein